MTAQIDGVSWVSASSARKAKVGNFGVIEIQGSQNGTTIILPLYNIDSVGTYLLGVSGTNLGGIAQISDNIGRFWTTPASGAAGTITLTTLTSTRIAGSFAFTADSSFGNAQGSRTVTQGHFDLPLTGTLATLPDQYGSRLNGTVGGSPFEGATVLSTVVGSALTINASNTSYSIGLVKSSFTGVGTYTVSLLDAAVVVLGPYTNPNGAVNCCWSSGAGSSGTLTVTSLTPTRIKGTLTATLPATPGTAASGPISLATAFDIGIP